MPPSNAQKLRLALKKPVVLVGMMGSGKTHTGRLLATAAGLDFHDMDALIEQKAGMSIPDIFEKFGEEKFRESENNTLREVLSQGVSIISTGGGVVLRSENMALMQEQGIMVWLDAPADILWERLKDNKTRPLLQTPDPQATLDELLSARKSHYAQAHIHMHIDKNNAANIHEDIIKSLSAYLNNDR
jgi:shikimate kinase